MRYEKSVGLAVSLSVMLGFTSQADTASLASNEVDARAKWLGHIDFDALRASTVVQAAVKKVQERHQEAEQHLAMVRGMIGMDPCQDLHGLTFYGTQLGAPTGVLIVHAKMDA